MEQIKSPKFTAAGSPILMAWHYQECADGPVWQTPPPMLVSLRSLRGAEFKWDEDAVTTFFHAMFRKACERRIAEGHKGLLNFAATTLAKTAVDVFFKACSAQHIIIEDPYSNVPDMIEPIIEKMLNRSRLQSYSDKFFRFLAKTSLSDCELTHNHPTISISNGGKTVRDRLYEVAAREHREQYGKFPRMQFNQILDIIACYCNPIERIKYRPLETVLTAANRVIYVISNRAY